MKVHPPFSRQKGMVLLAVIILAALVLLGAATFGVLYVRQLNQNRQIQTQRQLEVAFHGLFPGNERKAPNMNADFGYNPTNPGAPPLNYYDLRAMVDLGQVSKSFPSPAISQLTGAMLVPGVRAPGAWNGPYWSGSVDGLNRPVDGWGRPMQLRYISTSIPPGWQVFSVGANGVSQTGDAATPSGDDQVFPVAPYKVPVVSAATCPSPKITFYRGTSFNPAEDITLTVTDGAGAVQTTAPLTVNNGGGNRVIFTLSATTPGTISIVAHSSKEGPPHNRGPWGTPPTPKTYTLTSSCSPSNFLWDITAP